MNPLDKIPLDKSHHFIAGALVGDVAAVAVILAGHPEYAWGAALALAMLAGAFKEALDWRDNHLADAQVHGVEFMDALATTLGGVAVAIPLAVQAYV